MLREWRKQMDHEVTIRVSGLCSRKIFMTDEELILMPFTMNQSYAGTAQ